jgi:transcription elongation GreA/GreB family factor
MASETEHDTLTEELPAHLAEKLKGLTPGRYVTHRSWGVGKIRENNEALGQLIIDFATKRGHAMEHRYATESLVLLSDEHIFVLKAERSGELKAQAAQDPVAVMRVVILSLAEQANADVIQAALSPEVVTASDWKKWWEAAKRGMKKDGHFYVPTKRSEAFRILSAPNAVGEESLVAFRAAVGAKAQMATLLPVVKAWEEIKADAVADELVAAMNATLSKIPKSQLTLALELALSRDEFITLAGRPPQSGALATFVLAPQTANRLNDTLDALPAVKQGKLLKVVQEGLPGAWVNLFLDLLPRANSRVASAIAEAFVEAGRSEEFVAAVNRRIRERSVTCDFLFWLCKNRPVGFANLIEPQLFLAILSVLEKDQLSEIKKGTKLYELVLGDKALIADILKNAPVEDVRDITRAILLSPVFEELDRRSLLATIIKLYPQVQSMVIGEKSSGTENATLIVSWTSLDQRRSELEEIVTKKIPQNSQEIGIARSYGDLRENHEFKAAKEMQTVLMRRKAELEDMLTRAQGTDFANVDTNEVRIGTKVTLKETANGKTLLFTILGAWDSDPNQDIISYLTPVAKALMGRKAGDTVKLLTEEAGEREVRIEKIQGYR